MDPNNWNTDSLASIKVGDTFTEEWLDRVRALMLAFNEAQALLREARAVLDNYETDGDYNNDGVIAMNALIDKFLAP